MAAQAYTIGVDIGTTNIKAVALSLQGDVLATETISVTTFRPAPDLAEQDPEAIFQSFKACLSTLLGKAHGTPLGLAFSTAMHSVIALGPGYQVLTNALIWSDNRGWKIAQTAKAQGADQALTPVTGTPWHPMAPIVKIAWWAKAAPAVFQQASKFISIKEYIWYRLTGKFEVDYSIASATGLFDIRQKVWHQPALDFAGITLAQLSTPCSPYHGTVLQPGQIPGLTAPLPIFLGASDGCLANLGTGTMLSKDLAITLGTSGAIRKTISQPSPLLDSRLFCYVLDENWYVTGGATNNGAISMEWYLQQVLQNQEAAITDLIDTASDLPPGAEGLLFLPYLMGERSPIWDAAASAAFIGLTYQHTSRHLVSAMMEGALMALYSIGQLLANQAGESQCIWASGGFTRSSRWLQMLADVFGLPVYTTANGENSALGACFMAMKALGILPDYTAIRTFMPVKTTYHPRQQEHATYKGIYKVFQHLYPALKSSMEQLKTLRQGGGQ